MSLARVMARQWSLSDSFFWLFLAFVPWIFPNYLVLGSQILITGLFAVSLDLMLGYAGIVSLGHAAYFGVGAYAAGLLAAHGWGEPVSGLLAGAVIAGAVGYLASFLVVRGSDLTRLMVTLGVGLLLYEAANKASYWTGGVDGLSGVTVWRILGIWSFDIEGKLAYAYSLVVLLLAFLVLRRIVDAPFGWSLREFGKTASACPPWVLLSVSAW